MTTAARVGDDTIGPPAHPVFPGSHLKGTIVAPASLNVSANSKQSARVTDRLQCSCGLPDFIVTGSATVKINGLFAAREGSVTMHGGVVKHTTATVNVGGASAGASFGNLSASQAVFLAMAAGRQPPPGTTFPNGTPIPAGTNTQSYNNCGIESSRQILRQATGSTITQEALLNQATANGWATQGSTLFGSGGSWATGRAALLNANGVPSHTEPPDMAHLQQAVADRRGVSADIWAAKVWPPNVVANQGVAVGSNNLAHAITVTGMQYDATGQLQSVIINDTGMGTVNQAVPAQQFAGALMGPTTPSTHLVTDKPIW